MDQNTSRVIVKKCENYDYNEISSIISDSFKALNLEPELKNIKNVLLKPNLVMAKEPKFAVTTHPVIVDALCENLKKINKNLKIIIGEASGSVLFEGTKKAFKVSGLEDVAKKYDAKIVYFETSKRKKVAVNGGIIKEFNLPEEILDCDFIINLPKLKTHTFVRYTGAVKNLFGLLSTDQKMNCHKKLHRQKDFVANLINLHNAVKPDLNIMDGVIGMDGNGPTTGHPKKIGYILISQDALALDYTASNLVGFKNKSNPLINYAEKNKLINKIELLGDDIKKIKIKKPFGLRTMIPELLGSKIQNFLIPNVTFDAEKCKKCFVCVKACPAAALKLDKNIHEKPQIDYDICLRCYCCHELCPNKAISLKGPFKNITNKLLRRK